MAGHISEGDGRVLEVMAQDGDHSLQAAGHFLHIPPGWRWPIGLRSQGVVGGVEEVPEPGLLGHGPAPASRSVIRAAQVAASRQAARSAPSVIVVAVRARPVASSSLTTATELLMTLALPCPSGSPAAARG